MGKASSSKKVARAAGTGGGRTNRGKTPVLWYSTLVLILVAGIGVTAFSREQRLDKLNSPESKEEPRAGQDHWHVALGVRICDNWLAPVVDESENRGIHTHGDGLIHVEPGLASVAGRRAIFNRFAEGVKAELEADRFVWPVSGGKKEERKTGDKCGEQEAEVTAFYDGKPVEGDPGDIRFTDGGKLVLAFVPKGTTYEAIGDPPSTAELVKQGSPDPAAAAQSSQQDPTASPVTEAPHPEGTPHAEPPASTPSVPLESPPTFTPPPSTPAASTPPASSAPVSAQP